MTLQFVQVARPSADLLAGSPGIEPSDCVRSYAFMANLAAQEATGDAGASAPAERILTELKGSSEYDTLLFAAVANVGPLGSPSELGFPTVPATVSATATATGSGEFGSSYLGHDYCGFVRVGLPLAEDLDIAELELVLDVDYLPLPGEDFADDALLVAQSLLDFGTRVAAQLGRHVIRTGVAGNAGGTRWARVLAPAEFDCKHVQRQLVFEIGNSLPALLFPRGVHAASWSDYAIDEQHVQRVADLLTVATADADYGSLAVEPAVWTPQRLNDARQRLADRRAHTLLTAIIAPGITASRRATAPCASPGGTGDTEAACLSEFSRYDDARADIAEWTLTVTDRTHRGSGLAWLSILTALREMAHIWPKVTRVYASIGGNDAAMASLFARLGARELTRTELWERKIEP